jgi:hypothetical protein
MFRRFVLGILATIVVALVGGYFALSNGIIPANADATPWVAGNVGGGDIVGCHFASRGSGYQSYPYDR